MNAYSIYNGLLLPKSLFKTGKWCFLDGINPRKRKEFLVRNKEEHVARLINAQNVCIAILIILTIIAIFDEPSFP